MFDGMSQRLPDIDPVETSEWLDSLDSVVHGSGRQRARYLLGRVLDRAREQQVGLPALVSTPYVNTISPEREPVFPGDEEMELHIRRLVRWNAAVMVSRANLHSDGIGGHLSTYASSASLYEVGFNHFFRGKTAPNGAPQSGDQVFYQGHATPGVYARAFLEGRFSEAELDRFRREAGPERGLSSYPHPRLMPDFWEFPTVSMGLGPLNAIYQARFNRYLQDRGIIDTSDSRVWCFLGDGECDEPETLGALSLAGREHLDNLIFVLNANLQRLDGPVRGNGKIIQELEAVFRGAGWDVIKVVWGREWDDLLARDVDGVLVRKMDTTVDGQFQKYAAEPGSYIREHFFGPDPRLRTMVAHLSDEDLKKLRRGGHDYRKVYAAYLAATRVDGSPTVIIAKTVKGWTLGPGFESRNVTHQMKKLNQQELLAFRDLLELPIPDSALTDGEPPYYHPGPDAPEIQYLKWRRAELGGPVPERRVVPFRALRPAPDAFAEFPKGTGAKVSASTTMAFVRLLRNLLRDPELGERVVPIVPDEARTFGMDSLFREVKIYAPEGQLYEPVDSELFLHYAEAQEGQILEEGITEAGSMSSFTAAGTSYATHGQPMIPFYIYYSMFGYQRVGDLMWAAGDARARGFLLGATSGRTTLHGEGLQHQDGHSMLTMTVIPSARVYDPAFAYETALIVRDGLRRMLEDGEDLMYYLALYNENYPQPAMPEGVEEGVVNGLYQFRAAPEGKAHAACVLGSGPMVNIALRAQDLLAEEWDVGASVWSATSYQLLRRDALEVERWNRLHPEETPRVPLVTTALADSGPVVAVTDHLKAVADQVARWVPAPFTSLGTDGWGRSDTREQLRRRFEVDAEHLVVAVLADLAQTGAIPTGQVSKAIHSYGIDPEAPSLVDT